MIVDRDDLQTQEGKLFLRSEEFLSLGTAKVIANRAILKTELSLRESGSFFICTIQKFCEEISELNTRKNIICFSDEALRTQIRLNKQLKIRDRKNADEVFDDEQLGAFITKSYADFEKKAFYDILIHLRDKHNFEYGKDKNIDEIIINDKCKTLAKKTKELIDIQSYFTD